MQEQTLHRGWRTVTDPEAARTIADRRKLRYLEPFIGREGTVAGVARELEVSAHRMLYQVRRLVRLGLLEVTRESPRAGRAVRHYRAVADGFFTPFALTGLDSPEQLTARVAEGSRVLLDAQVGRAWMTAGGGADDWGIHVYRTAEGDVFTNVVPTPDPAAPRAFFDALLTPQAPPVWYGGFTLSLGREDAKALQRELGTLGARYRARERPDGEAYLVRVAMAPLDG